MHKDVDYKAFKSCKVGFLFRPTSYLRYLEINWCKIMYCLLETILKDRSLSSVSNNLYWGHSHEHTVAWCMNLLLQCWGPLLSQILHWIRDSLYADTRGVSVSVDTLRSYSHPRVHSPGMPRNHLLRPETSDGCPWLRRWRRCKKNAGQNSSL